MRKNEVDYIHCEKSDFGNENWEGRRSTEVFWPIRCFQSEKDIPPRDLTLLMMMMRDGVMTSCKGTSDWRVWLKMARGWCGKVVEAGCKISAERQQREHYSLLLEKGDSGRLWFLEEENKQVKQRNSRNCLRIPGHEQGNCLNFWACEGRQPSLQLAGYKRSSHGYPFPQDILTSKKLATAKQWNKTTRMFCLEHVMINDLLRLRLRRIEWLYGWLPSFSLQ